MLRWKIWAALATALLAGSVFSLLNFRAAVDLAYDTTQHGKAVLRGWGYATLTFLVAGVVAAGFAWGSWRRRTRLP